MGKGIIANAQSYIANIEGAIKGFGDKVRDDYWRRSDRGDLNCSGRAPSELTLRNKGTKTYLRETYIPELDKTIQSVEEQLERLKRERRIINDKLK